MATYQRSNICFYYFATKNHTNFLGVFVVVLFCFKHFFKKVFIYFEREREREGERQRERLPSGICTVTEEPDSGLRVTNREIMTRAATKSQTLNRLSHPDAPVVLC